MKKSLFLAILALPLMISAEYNSTAIQNIKVINKFKADSLKICDTAWEWSANENKTILVLFNDTNNTGFETDTVKFKYGYQRGFTTVNSLGKIDTTWRSLVTVDSVSTLPTDTAGKWICNTNYGSIDTLGYENMRSGMMDTSGVTGYAVAEHAVCPNWSGLVRLWAKGLTGNSTTNWIKLKLQLSERSFVSVRQK
jgi:hypothetical protein